MTATRSQPPKPLDPDPDLWSALGEGATLRAALDDFYAEVYADPRLSPFFEGVTRDRAAGKQYAFLAEIFTGRPHYFGERPRNAHSWMVISNELFDHREALMARALRRRGLGEAHVARCLAVDEAFRKQIVKDRPRGRRYGALELPAEGYDEEELAVGTLCDRCGGEMAAGERAHYHVRTGRAYCAPCWPALAGAPGAGPGGAP
jgi:truncated hemoglobin YjbI